MLTVMHMTKEWNQVYEVLSVQEFPWPRTIHEGTKAERIQPPSVFIINSETLDGSGIHLYEGSVYVMNSSGKTVATFEVRPTPPADGKDDALLAVEPDM